MSVPCHQVMGWVHLWIGTCDNNPLNFVEISALPYIPHSFLYLCRYLWLYLYLYLFTIFVLGTLATTPTFSWKWCPSIHPAFLCKSQAPYPRISNMITDFHALWGNLSCGDLIPMRQMYQNVWEVIDPDRPFRTDIFPNREVIQSGVGSSLNRAPMAGKTTIPLQCD